MIIILMTMTMTMKTRATTTTTTIIIIIIIKSSIIGNTNINLFDFTVSFALFEVQVNVTTHIISNATCHVIPDATHSQPISI